MRATLICLISLAVFSTCIDAAMNVCFLPPAVGPCRAAFHRYYFNLKRNNCYEFIYGGCRGNDNNFETYEECMNSCAISSNFIPRH